ncbi:MAG TPA: hypothetical protein VNL16_03655 [Chloroflexota bacterium]|nr:hypothetical protein [Chloroflexota bacterium]
MQKVVLGPARKVEISEEEDARITGMIEQTERDVEAHRVTLRWERPQIEVIKRAAALYGLPYQSYLKQAAFRQALADLKTAQEVCPELASTTT